VWLLVRRGGLWTAALAAIAVTVIADRTMARAAMFTALLFASLLTMLWEYHETGRAPLWSLPLLMLAWVNLHLGFEAGLALIAAYVGIELLEALWPARRKAALERLRRSWGWLLAAVFATLANPWGWGVYRALARQQSAMKQHSLWIAEWSPLRLNWTAISSAFSLHTTSGDIYLLVIAAVAGVTVAIWRRRFGVALLLAAAAWLDTQHVRYNALFAAVVVVLAAAAFADATAYVAARFHSNRSLLLRSIAVLFISAFVLFRVSELVRGRNYLEVNESTAFGVGLSPQMPSGAAGFLAHVDVGGNVFNTYEEGGFLSFVIGRRYPDYVDGRALPFGQQLIGRSGELSKAQPDSPEWQKEIARYNIAAIVLPLARYNVLEYFPALDQFCHSDIWKPVYLDDSSVVFVRRGEATIALLPVDCATAPLPAVPPTGTDRNAFDRWVNASAVLRSLGRNTEATAANERALAMFPTSAYARWNQAILSLMAGNLPAAEEQLRLAARYDPACPVIWANLGDVYEHQGKLADAIAVWEKASKLDPHSWNALLPLAYLYLEAHRPEDARAAFDELSSILSSDPQSVLPGATLARLLRGRAAVAVAMGDSAAAQRLEDEALRHDPGSPDDWRQLAHIYAIYGRASDAQRAEQHANDATSSGENR
jgi:tetratricopeptide (TPR) repeat protein